MQQQEPFSTARFNHIDRLEAASFEPNIAHSATMSASLTPYLRLFAAVSLMLICSQAAVAHPVVEHTEAQLRSVADGDEAAHTRGLAALQRLFVPFALLIEVRASSESAGGNSAMGRIVSLRRLKDSAAARRLAFGVRTSGPLYRLLCVYRL